MMKRSDLSPPASGIAGAPANGPDEEPLRLSSGFPVFRKPDSDALRGRSDGRARKVPGGGTGHALSATLYERFGGARALEARTLRRGQFVFDARQRAVVKIHYFSHGGGGAAALRAHGRYIARDGAERSSEGRPVEETHAEPHLKEDDAREAARAHASYLARSRSDTSPFYDRDANGVDGAKRLAQWAARDRRHFRVILSAENASSLADLPAYVRAVMAQAEIALDTRLQWVAVDHWDTGNPHTHVVLRGRRDDGRDLLLPRMFVSHSMRETAREIATDWLGPRSRADERIALLRETRAHRPTRLDGLIASQLERGGRVRLAHLRAPKGSQHLADALKARVRELKRLGLVEERGRNVFIFAPEWRARLSDLELHLDVRKSVLRDRARESGKVVRAMSKSLRMGPDR